MWKCFFGKSFRYVIQNFGPISPWGGFLTLYYACEGLLEDLSLSLLYQNQYLFIQSFSSVWNSSPLLFLNGFKFSTCFFVGVETKFSDKLVLFRKGLSSSFRKTLCTGLQPLTSCLLVASSNTEPQKLTFLRSRTLYKKDCNITFRIFLVRRSYIILRWIQLRSYSIFVQFLF